MNVLIVVLYSHNNYVYVTMILLQTYDDDALYQGDKVEVMGGKLFVNGVEQDEPFKAEDAEYEFGPVLVPPGNVLCLGDNRNHSLDGHIWGFLPPENVIGRAVFVYWPPWRVGTTGMY